MGCRLEGPRLQHRGSSEMVTDGMILGAVQVPPDGQPIVMLSDRATTGGYPKIGTVIGADIPRLAPRVPGDGMGGWWCLLSSILIGFPCGAGAESDEEEILVSAAASLREVISKSSELFQGTHPGLRLQLNFASSGALGQQIEVGSPVDVFVSAAPEHLDRLSDLGL